MAATEFGDTVAAGAALFPTSFTTTATVAAAKTSAPAPAASNARRLGTERGALARCANAAFGSSRLGWWPAVSSDSPSALTTGCASVGDRGLDASGAATLADGA